jgi:hypothetical protein
VSTNPSIRRATNRPRHRVTVPELTRNRSATSVFDSPSAHASTIFARTANLTDPPCDHRSNCSRSGERPPFMPSGSVSPCSQGGDRQSP